MDGDYSFFISGYLSQRLINQTGQCRQSQPAGSSQQAAASRQQSAVGSHAAVKYTKRKFNPKERDQGDCKIAFFQTLSSEETIIRSSL